MPSGKSEYPVRHADQHRRDGSDPLLNLPGRIIWGSLADDGSIINPGSGDWTTPTGSTPYEVDFDDFAEEPIAIATVTTQDSAGGASVQVDTVTTGSVTFLGFDVAGAPYNPSFGFVIVGSA